MMLITLTILLPLVHSVEGECQATPLTIVNTSALPEPIIKELEKEGIITWNNQTSLATYYHGFPDLHKLDNRFFAVCVAGLENRSSRHCINSTHKDGQFEGRIITVGQFLKFHDACKNDVFAGINDPEEDEDDWDEGKDASREGLQELEKAAGLQE